MYVGMLMVTVAGMTMYDDNPEIQTAITNATQTHIYINANASIHKCKHIHNNKK